MFTFTANKKEGDLSDPEQSNQPKERLRSTSSNIDSTTDYKNARSMLAKVT